MTYSHEVTMPKEVAKHIAILENIKSILENSWSEDAKKKLNEEKQ